MIKISTGFVAAVSMVLGLVQPVSADETGKQLFQATCFACHTIGEGQRVGPDLKDVHLRRSEEWIIKFVQDSQAVIKSGDPDAVALFKAFNSMPMPPNDLSDTEVRHIISYIALVSGSAPEAQPTAAAVPFEGTPEMVELGRNLFQGSERLANGGPACNSCHHVKNDAVIGGGVLARELTQVFSRMGEAGVASILGSSPFPVMDAAYQDNALTKDEIDALVAFLQHADSEHAWQKPRDYGWGLFVSGIVGSALLLGFFALIGRRRKRQSVNQAIYDRQIRSI